MIHHLNYLWEAFHGSILYLKFVDGLIHMSIITVGVSSAPGTRVGMDDLVIVRIVRTRVATRMEAELRVRRQRRKNLTLKKRKRNTMKKNIASHELEESLNLNLKLKRITTNEVELAVVMTCQVVVPSLDILRQLNVCWWKV